MNLKRIFQLCKKEFFSAVINPATLFAGIIFYAVSVVPFFFIQPFFVEGRGSADLRPFFVFFPYLCAFILPVLTMNGGKVSDFFDSLPFSLFETVAAKCLSSFFIMLLFILPTLSVPLITSFFAEVEAAVVITAYAGIILFCAASCAAGVYFALAVKNNLAAYLLTSLVLFLSAIIHLLPLYVTMPDFAAKSINFFSFAWHFDAASKGIFDTRDFVFYLSCTAGFLSLAVLTSKKYQYEYIYTQKVQKIIHVKNKYRLFLLFCVLLSLNAQRFYVRFDFSKTKTFSLSTQTEKLLAKIPDKLRITYYVSPKLANIYPQTRDISDFLRAYARSSSQVSLTQVDPHVQGMQKTLESIGVLPQQIQTSDNSQTSLVTVYSAIVLEYGGKTAQIPFILSTAGLEYDLNIRVQYLTEGISRAVYILPLDEDFDSLYKYVVPWLESSGFTSLVVEPADLPYLDRTLPLFIVGSPDISVNDAAEIERFVFEGGSAAFAVSPFSVQTAGNWSATPQSGELLNLLDFWGFTIGNSMVLDSVNYRISMQTNDENKLYEFIDYPFWIRVLPQNMNKKSPLADSFYGLYSYWASPLYLSPEKGAVPLFTTSAQSWLNEPAAQEPYIVTDPFSKQKPDAKTLSRYTLAAVSNGPSKPYYSLSRPENRAGRIAVIADRYFCSNMIEYTNSPQNIDFLTNLLLWISSDEDLLALRGKGASPAVLTKITNAAQLSAAKTKTALVLVLLPAVTAAFYTGFMIKRRKKR